MSDDTPIYGVGVLKWLSFEEWCSVDTLRTMEPSFRLSLTLMKRSSRLEAGQPLLSVETCSLVPSKNGVLTALVLERADAALVELGQLLVTYGQGSQQLLLSRPTITRSTR